jgi:plastocyanin
MKLRLLASFVAVALALSAAGAATARPKHASGATVNVAMKDFSFVLSSRTVRHGQLTFRIRNAGHTIHDFAIAGHASKVIGPGKTTALTVRLKKGRYPYRCTVDAHAELGMKGVLRVR